MAACWLNQDQPRNKTRPWFAIASRGNKNRPKTVLQSTATKIVTKLMNWNQYRVGTLRQRVHTDCLGRKFSPQRSQYTVALPHTGIQTSDRRQLTALAVPKTTGRRVSFGAGRFTCTIVLAGTNRRNTHRPCRALFHFRAVLPSWLRGSVAGPPLRRRVLESIRYPVTGARRNPPPLCGPRPAGRPVSFPDPLFASPNSSTAHSGR